tara:strand:- start:6226 stop:6468 length:243 start_codon:yes stop_codon:yes gene_type:complete
MCIGMDCSTAWNPEPFKTLFECEISSKEVVRDLSTTFPDSDGESYCLTKLEFEKWKDAVDNGVQPQLQKRHPSNILEQLT